MIAFAVNEPNAIDKAFKGSPALARPGTMGAAADDDQFEDWPQTIQMREQALGDG